MGKKFFLCLLLKVKCRLHGSGKRRVETRDSACGRSGPNSESDHPDKIIKSDGATTSSSAASNNMAEVNKFEHLAKFINEKAKISLAKERKAARTMTIIVLVRKFRMYARTNTESNATSLLQTFVVCWLPFFLMYVILPFCGDHCYVSNKVSQISSSNVLKKTYVHWTDPTNPTNLIAGCWSHHLARLRQLHPEPDHLHDLQHGLQGCVHEDNDVQGFRDRKEIKEEEEDGDGFSVGFSRNNITI